MIRIVNLHRDKWSFNDLIPHMSDILRLFEKMEQKFPDDCTAQHLFLEAYTAKKSLWLVLEDEKVIAVGLSHIRTIDATGKKIATMANVAGEGFEKYVDKLCAEAEQWATDNGADFPAIEARPGWGPTFRKLGYQPFMVLYRKQG